MLSLIKTTDTMNEIEIAKKIEELTGINVFKNTRKREYVEMRSLYCYILRKKYRKTFESISDIMQKNGKKSDHSTIVHAVTMYKQYEKNNKDLQIINDLFTVKGMPKIDVTNAIHQISIIEELKGEVKTLKYKLKQYKDNVKPLHKLIDSIPTERQEEAYKRIDLMIKSWSWKYEDKCEVISGYNSIEAY